MYVPEDIFVDFGCDEEEAELVPSMWTLDLPLRVIRVRARMHVGATTHVRDARGWARH